MSEITTDKLQEIVIEAMEDLKADQVRHINVEGVTGFTDRMVFATGTSSRHVKSIAQSVVEACKKAGVSALGVEGEDVGDWVLVDLGEIVVHVMLQETRDFYDIERLWNDHVAARSAAK